MTIKIQGSRDWDFREVNKKAGILNKRNKAIINGHKQKYGDVTWHHVDYDPKTNTARMQLVTRADHEAKLPHKGSVKAFEDFTGTVYDTDEAKAAAKKINSH